MSDLLTMHPIGVGTLYHARGLQTEGLVIVWLWLKL